MADDAFSPAARNKMTTRLYWKDAPDDHPGYVDMYMIDANDALRRSPDQYSLEPWGDDEPVSVAVARTVIPGNWRDLSTNVRRAIAQELGAPPDVLPGDADKVIQDEEKRRNDVAAAESERAEQKAAQRRPLAQPPERLDIPADWEDLPFAKRRALAIKLGAPHNVRAEEADEMIRAELVRRAGNPDRPGGE